MWCLSCLGNATSPLAGCLVVGDVPLNRERMVALAALAPKALVQGVAKPSKKRGSTKSTACESVLPSIQGRSPTSPSPQHWSVLGAVRGDSDGTKKFVISTLQEQSLYSLTKVTLPWRAINPELRVFSNRPQNNGKSVLESRSFLHQSTALMAFPLNALSFLIPAERALQRCIDG